MFDRFYLPGDWHNHIVIDGSEAHHLSHVLRKTVGDRVEVFDGRGGSAEAAICALHRRHIELELLTDPVRTPIPAIQLTLAVAPPKRDRFQWLVEKATELGVDRVVPIQTARTVVQPGGGKLERLNQTVIEACKQSHRNHLMPILHSHDFDQLTELARSESAKLVYGVPAQNDSTQVDINEAVTSTAVIVVIGPEGGLTPTELDFLKGVGARSLTVSNNILRVETAAVALAAILRFNLNAR